MANPGLTPTEQRPATAAATVDADEATPSEMWRTIVTSDGFQRTLADAVRSLLSDVPYFERASTLYDVGVTAADGGYARLATGFDRPPESDAYELAVDVTAAFGQGEVTTIGLSGGFEDLPDGPLAVLDAADVVPSVTVEVSQAFLERDRRQRVDLCQLLATLAQGFDIHLVATAETRGWLAREHHADLPGVRDWCNVHRGSSPVAERVDAARTELDPDGRAVALLRRLADEPSETLPYDDLYAAATVAEETVRGRIATLADCGLVERLGPQSDRQVTLLPAGQAFLEECPRQSILSTDSFNHPKNLPKAVQPPLAWEGGEDRLASDRTATTADADTDSTADPYRTVCKNPTTTAAAAACGRAGSVTLVRGPIDLTADDRVREVSYDDDRDEAVIGVRATTPRQYLVSVATALTSPKLLDPALPPARLETVVDAVEDSATTLRDRRCIGWLPDEALADGEVLRDTLVEAGRDLADLTTLLKHKDANGEDAGGLPGTILRKAHGLAGALSHLLDVAGIDLIREVQVEGGLALDALDELAESIARSTAIQSKYGAFATNRQLYETRIEKRQAAPSPAVDAADPTGEFIGSIVLRGPDVHRLRDPLEDALAAPGQVVDDAPAFVVPVDVREVGRAAFERVVERVLQTKRLRSTETAVALLEAFVGTPYDAARALHALGTEDQPRDIRPGEVRAALRCALAGVDWGLTTDRILPDAAGSTPGKVIAALLAVDEPITQTELAKRAGVSTQSIRNHRETLVALNLLEWDDTGYRLALPFTDERDAPEDALPWFATPNAERDDYRDATEKGVIWEVVDDFAPPDVVDTVRETLGSLLTTQIPPDARRTILDLWPVAEPYLEVVRSLAADEPARAADVETVTFGREPVQTPLSPVVTA